MGGADAPRRRIAACVPLRRGPRGLEVLLVTSRRRPGCWVLPKGGVACPADPADDALRECWEEAGAVCGSPRSLGTVWSALQRSWIHGFAARVRRLGARWPEQGQRQRRWFSAEAALRALDRPELVALVERALAVEGDPGRSPAGPLAGPTRGARPGGF